MKHPLLLLVCLISALKMVSTVINCERSHISLHCDSSSTVQFSNALFTRQPSGQSEPNCHICCYESDPSVTGNNKITTDAYYGINHYQNCNNQFNLSQILTNYCAIQKMKNVDKCDFDVTVSFWQQILNTKADLDPCHDVYKYLDYDYECVDKGPVIKACLNG